MVSFPVIPPKILCMHLIICLFNSCPRTFFHYLERDRETETDRETDREREIGVREKH